MNSEISQNDNFKIFVKINTGIDSSGKEILPNQFLQVSVLLFGNRILSKQIPHTQKFSFNETFNFELKGNNTDSLKKYIKLNSPIHIVIMKINNENYSEIISSRKVEWRHILYARQKMDYDLKFYGPNFKEKGAIFSLKIQFGFSQKIKKSQLIPQHDIIKQLTQEQKFSQMSHKNFNEIAGNWWDTIKDNEKIHKKHLIRIFAECEDRELLYF